MIVNKSNSNIELSINNLENVCGGYRKTSKDELNNLKITKCEYTPNEPPKKGGAIYFPN